MDFEIQSDALQHVFDQVQLEAFKMSSAFMTSNRPISVCVGVAVQQQSAVCPHFLVHPSFLAAGAVAPKIWSVLPNAVIACSPRFVCETLQLHGNDTLVSGPGNSMLMGDDIRGFTALDLTTKLSSALVRQQALDNLDVNLSARMSRLEFQHCGCGCKHRPNHL
jgi:hypothetical protein